MSIKSKKIPLTVRMDNALYQRFHENAYQQGANHNAVLCRLAELYVIYGGDILDLGKRARRQRDHAHEVVRS